MVSSCDINNYARFPQYLWTAGAKREEFLTAYSEKHKQETLEFICSISYLPDQIIKDWMVLTEE